MILVPFKSSSSNCCRLFSNTSPAIIAIRVQGARPTETETPLLMEAAELNPPRERLCRSLTSKKATVKTLQSFIFFWLDAVLGMLFSIRNLIFSGEV